MTLDQLMVSEAAGGNTAKSGASSITLSVDLGVVSHLGARSRWSHGRRQCTLLSDTKLQGKSAGGVSKLSSSLSVPWRDAGDKTRGDTDIVTGTHGG
eukprot:CAMPEP_0175834586 /NCGR_PEP_ID=MMETSP0107_2-20121207/16136_1 /TAXON_ID=195067 ORGANISM="Goniomonas pacifica, Strain CCMP1869" /NCGR_SAMPLE_ID=MMETSP0107_2 /ASSEMBLY_ACC=CAM_ASM_000203 /LENGTH=96 /DNA_ID=CAMNT_0017147819 /DNA_START=323 /DNA_END=613 /DNA_ORIENTATION=-